MRYGVVDMSNSLAAIAAAAAGYVAAGAAGDVDAGKIEVFHE